ncbi:SUMF1/EgtB/PvdO family nonheme iron enzyme [Roseofilum reptotaenium CS-1145]|uniref:Sulfatase-modifying factor enzyme-like domain-containing protein n=1 Tax=Roseofilum reptotaenium AO1-A TaxID=1925591 RepID=A0A1L9QPN5_9CYAN|nr:SUMF1/EgtB/PvdO family nonheme iron enzyme [Roseofilum reptotaenium]MDB9515775.1 SUMF1/EgtB/PvdO family nonheme iron enzyme [Roseofilum reptotaenium CS-1145]OJJ24624.1 hypothetical protein BI308_15845 [Roseofilum reptotaenium AO1-A]
MIDLSDKLQALTDVFDLDIPDEINPDSIRMINLKHRNTGMIFKYIPGGEFVMGLTEEQEIEAGKIYDYLPFDSSEMKPCTRVEINPFLVSETPLLNGIAKEILGQDSIAEENPYYPAFLSRQDCERVTSYLNCRLPSEAEWEYFCRGGTNTLFVFGNQVLEYQEMEKWLLWDFSNLKIHYANLFGLYGIFVGEWCQDRYRENYDIKNPPEDDVYVIRGGGAIFWPWQDQEWIWCMSAIRMSSKDLLEDRTCAMRLVYNLP